MRVKRARPCVLLSRVVPRFLSSLRFCEGAFYFWKKGAK
ncbi:hypothetical protein CHCC12620_3338 [Bacillus paralicheniformis]|nr:hypothetical protein CHCC12620_3338 [Bacillus paralicheniformis]